jgi:hypothetical protein
MGDRRPQVIVRCASTPVVASAARLAREHDLEIGVRCGGHATAPRQATFTAPVSESGASFVPAEPRGRPLASVGSVWVGDLDQGRRSIPSIRAHAVGVAPGLRRRDRRPGGLRECIRPGRHGVRVRRSGLWSGPAEDEARIAAALRCAAALDRFASGPYVNVLIDDFGEVARAYPPDKLARLTALKTPTTLTTSSTSIRTSGPVALTRPLTGRARRGARPAFSFQA